MNPVAPLTTSPLSGLARIPVHEESQSFVENRQFRMLDIWDDVAVVDQIVYKVTFTNPVSVFSVKLGVFTGGRIYQVYRDSQIDTKPVAFDKSITPGPLNSVSHSGGSLPATAVGLLYNPFKSAGADVPVSLTVKYK